VDFVGAAACVARSLESDPDSPLTRALDAFMDGPNRIDELRALARDHPELERPRMLLGAILLARRLSPEERDEMLSDATRRRPTDVQAWLYRARAVSSRGQKHLAAEELQQVVGRSTSDRWARAAALQLLRLGRVGPAYRAAAAAFRRRPSLRNLAFTVALPAAAFEGLVSLVAIVLWMWALPLRWTVWSPWIAVPAAIWTLWWLLGAWSSGLWKRRRAIRRVSRAMKTKATEAGRP
jgi:hypothetical protein